MPPEPMDGEPVSHEHVDYWIDDTENGVAVFFRNNDTESTMVGGSEHTGAGDLIAVAKRWARNNGLGEIEYKPGGPDV